MKGLTHELETGRDRHRGAAHRAVRRPPQAVAAGFRHTLSSASFRAFVMDQLGRVVPRVRSRPMFGGFGIYAGDHFFALIADDTLYFKVDDSNRPDYEALGLQPFQPFGPGRETMKYYQVPADLLDEPDALRPWAQKEIAVARLKKKEKRT